MGAGGVVTDQQRAILELGDVNDAAVVLAGFLVQPAFGEGHRLAGRTAAIGRKRREHHPRTGRHGAVPAAALGAEKPAAVLLGKLLAGVEGQAHVGGVGNGFHHRRGQAFRRRFVGVLVGTHLAAAVPGHAELHSGLGCTIDLAWRRVVAHTVDLVVGEPELLHRRWGRPGQWSSCPGTGRWSSSSACAPGLRHWSAPRWQRRSSARAGRSGSGGRSSWHAPRGTATGGGHLVVMAFPAPSCAPGMRLAACFSVAAARPFTT